MIPPRCYGEGDLIWLNRQWKPGPELETIYKRLKAWLTAMALLKETQSGSQENPLNPQCDSADD